MVFIRLLFSLRKIKIFLSGFIFLLLTSPLFAASEGYSLDYWPSERRDAMQACYFNYEKRFKTPGVLKVAVSLGYSDTMDGGLDIVTDSFLLNSLKFHLRKKCQYKNQGFCEFKVVEERDHRPQYFTREFLTTFGGSVKVDLWIMNSSYKVSNSANTSRFKSEQLTQSESSKNFYSWALKTADIVLYEGHSRNGGGPDFFPPRQAKNGKVNYPWYQKNKPGLKLLLDSIKQAYRPPITLGLFSCASQSHFQKKLANVLPNTNTIMSTELVKATFTKEALLISLESLLNFECGDQLNRRLLGTSFLVNRSW